jgi:hypothetical protein
MLPLRRSLLLLLALAVMAGVAGCGGGSPSGKNATPEASATSDAGGAGATPPATSTGGTTPAPESLVWTRPNAGKLDPNGPEWASLRKGVQTMQSRPATDPTSWLYQANMHGTYDTPALQAWNSCQHGTYFFLSWHRMYLYYFERILRSASGDPKLALPFWDYTDPAQRAIPEPFRTPAGPQNSLYVAERAPGINDGAELPDSATTFDQAMQYTNFTSPAGSPLSFGGPFVPRPVHFGGIFGQLESQPHNIIHVLVGGDDGWMSDPNLAARDPIFWFHHANIDRLWSHWISLGGGRTDPTESGWLTQTFTFFDEKGQAVQMTGQQVLDTAQQLHYRYAAGSGDGPATEAVTESFPAKAFQNPKPQVVVDKPVAARLRGARTQVALAIPTAEPEAVGPDQGRLALVIEGIQYGRPGVFYEVYANLPAGTEPKPKDPHYVGNLAVFGQLANGQPAHGGHAGPDKSIQEDTKLAYDVTELVKRLRGQPGFKGDLKLDFVPKGLLPPKNRPQPEALPAVHEVRFARVKLLKQ